MFPVSQLRLCVFLPSSQQCNGSHSQRRCELFHDQRSSLHLGLKSPHSFYILPPPAIIVPHTPRHCINEFEPSI